MTGQDFLALQNEKIFRPSVMAAIIEEFVPPEDSFKITDAFMPMKEVNDEDLISMVKAGTFGMTNPVALGGDHKKISMPVHRYREHRAGYWRESIMFDEEVLQRVTKPEKPNQLWGEELMGEALNVLDIRLNTLIEYISAQTVINNGFSVNRNGVNYSFDANIPEKYYKYVGLAANKPAGYTTCPWKTGSAADLWSSLTTSKPLQDIRKLIDWWAEQGFSGDEIWMTRKIAGWLEDNTQGEAPDGLRYLIANNPELAGKMITAENIVAAVSGLKGLSVVIDNRRYLEEASILLNVAANGTEIYVDDVSPFSPSDVVTVRGAENDTEQDVEIESVDAVNRKITLSSTELDHYTHSALAAGDRVTMSKLYLPEDYVTLRSKTSNRRAPKANWISTPSLVKAKSYKNPKPGRYTWRDFFDHVPYRVEVGCGINGGPVVYGAGNWVVMKVN